MDTRNERRLAAKLKNGSTAALGEIIDGFSGYVCTVVRNFSRGTLTEDEIDELTGDIFYKLWESRERLDENIGLRAYLSTSARNAVKNRFRDTGAPPEDISELEIADGISVEDQAELNEMMRCLDEGLKTLPDREREVFARFYFFGERTSGIARVMGLSEVNVRAILSKTRSKLKDYLMKRGYDHV